MKLSVEQAKTIFSEPPHGVEMEDLFQAGEVLSKALGTMEDLIKMQHEIISELRSELDDYKAKRENVRVRQDAEGRDR